MKLAANIVYRDLETSPALNTTISKKIEKLFRLSERLQVQRVVVAAPHHHHHKGCDFEIGLEMSLGGKPLNVSNSHSNLHLAVRDLFAKAERAIKDEAGKHRGKRQYEKHAAMEQLTDDLDMKVEEPEVHYDKVG